VEHLAEAMEAGATAVVWVAVLEEVARVVAAVEGRAVAARVVARAAVVAGG